MRNRYQERRSGKTQCSEIECASNRQNVIIICWLPEWVRVLWSFIKVVAVFYVSLQMPHPLKMFGWLGFRYPKETHKVANNTLFKRAICLVLSNYFSMKPSWLTLLGCPWAWTVHLRLLCFVNGACIISSDSVVASSRCGYTAAAFLFKSWLT